MMLPHEQNFHCHKGGNAKIDHHTNISARLRERAFRFVSLLSIQEVFIAISAGASQLFAGLGMLATFSVLAGEKKDVMMVSLLHFDMMMFCILSSFFCEQVHLLDHSQP